MSQTKEENYTLAWLKNQSTSLRISRRARSPSWLGGGKIGQEQASSFVFCRIQVTLELFLTHTPLCTTETTGYWRLWVLRINLSCKWRFGRPRRICIGYYYGLREQLLKNCLGARKLDEHLWRAPKHILGPERIASHAKSLTTRQHQTWTSTFHHQQAWQRQHSQQRAPGISSFVFSFPFTLLIIIYSKLQIDYEWPPPPNTT